MKKYLLAILLCAPITAMSQGFELSDTSNNFIAYFVLAIVAIGLFLLCRELFCWYYKINRSISNQERIISLLEEISKKLGNTETEIKNN